MANDYDALKARYESAGQGHVFEYVDALTDSEKDSLIQLASSIPIEKIRGLWQAAALASNQSETSNVEPFSGPVGQGSAESVAQGLLKLGVEAIHKGQVAALVLAGGQGTRLGFDGPKGLYNIGLPSGRTLFQLMAERLVKLRQLAQADSPIPFYIMTSPLNHDETVDYFRQNDYFGMGAENIYFFPQGMLPCLTEDGMIIMESRSVIAMAPDGNGGLYPAMDQSGALADMRKRKVKYLHVFSIDNALVRPADPVFVGYCIEQGADCGNKVVWKAHAHEKVGVVALRQQRPCIVEYSEITTEMAERLDNETGRLVFGAGNICNHFYTLDFIEQSILPNMGNMYHIAKKNIPYYDEETGKTVFPTTNNGIKLETFIFDVFPLSKTMAVLDVDRSYEFAPVKNAPGSESDSPEIARDMISLLHKRWLVEAGAVLLGPFEESVCEIAPLTSYAGEGLEMYQGKPVVCPFTI